MLTALLILVGIFLGIPAAMFWYVIWLMTKDPQGLGLKRDIVAMKGKD